MLKVFIETLLCVSAVFGWACSVAYLDFEKNKPAWAFLLFVLGMTIAITLLRLEYF